MNPGSIHNKKKSTGGLYAKSQSSERLSGTHSSKKALVRSKQSASQTILKNHDPQIAQPEKPDMSDAIPKATHGTLATAQPLANNELILSKVICIQEQEQEEAERAAAL